SPSAGLAHLSIRYRFSNTGRICSSMVLSAEQQDAFTSKVFTPLSDKCREQKNHLGAVMRKLLATLVLIACTQFTLLASDKVIVHLPPTATAPPVAAPVAAEVLDAFHDTSHFEVHVPSV